MRQARLALLDSGLLSQVSAAIDALPEPGRTAAQIEWEFSQEVRRDSQLLKVVGGSLGFTEAQIDVLYVAAAKL
jgi:hypothetical protein